MKKNNLLLLAAFSMAIFACSPDNSEGSSDASSSDLVGTWYLGENPVWEDSLLGYRPDAITFTSDGKYKQESDYYKSEGTYTMKNGVLSVALTRVWWYDWQLKKLVEAADSEFSTLPTIYSPKFLYDKNVMIQKAELDSMIQLKEDSFELFFKEGSTVPSDSSLIQGFWNWRFFGDPLTTRIAVKFDGNNFELWNNAWHEHFSGTFEYKSGMVKFTIDQESFQIRRWLELPNDFQEELSSNLNERWLTPDPAEYDRMEPTSGWVFVMPFVVDGNEAYSSFANLHCILDKQ